MGYLIYLAIFCVLIALLLVIASAFKANQEKKAQAEEVEFQQTETHHKIWLYVICAFVFLLALYFIFTGRWQAIILVLTSLLPFIWKYGRIALFLFPWLRRLWRYRQDKNKMRQDGHHMPMQETTIMTKKRALAILGLKNGASRDDIIKAHREMIKRNHPDHGGSEELAWEINLAKDILLKDMN
jgi:DnaJ family protein C protein 19